jgi:hypothetical protein
MTTRGQEIIEAARLGAMLSPEAAEAIRAWHRRNWWRCAAHGEGEACCLDDLLGDWENPDGR